MLNPAEDLLHIRNLMERQTRFRAVSGLSVVLVGLYAGLACLYSLPLLTDRAYGPGGYDVATAMTNPVVQQLFLRGVLVLVLSLVTVFFFTLARARRQRVALFSALGLRLFEAMAVPLAAGGLLCLALYFHGYFWLVAPVTLVFYGVGLVGAGRMSYSELRLVGMADIALGLVAAMNPGYGLILWGVGFGLLHIALGLVLWLRYERGQPAEQTIN